MKDFDDGSGFGFQEMIDELESIVDDNSEILEPASDFMDNPLGIMTVGQALESNDPLANINNELYMVNREQRLFRNVFSASLEVYSSGISMLWDRMSQKDIDKLAEYLSEIQADDTLCAIKEIRNLVASELGAPFTEDQLFDFVGSEKFEEMVRPFDLKYQEMSEEMEETLLNFAKRNIRKLSARSS